MAGGSSRTANDPDCPHVSYRMLKCPWHTAWRESGLEDVGHFYCRCVDRAILRGFNPAFRLRLSSCLPQNPEEGCAFHWESAENTPALAQRQRRIQDRLRGTQVKDFLYHTAHLYRTLLRCARERNPAGRPRSLRRRPVWNLPSASARRRSNRCVRPHRATLRPSDVEGEPCDEQQRRKLLFQRGFSALPGSV